MKIGRAGKKVVTEKLSPIKSVKDSKVKNSTVEFGSVSDDNVTLAGGVKRAMSGKHLTTDSLVAQTSIARGEGEASPPRKRRSSTSSEAELDVFDEHAKQRQRVSVRGWPPLRRFIARIMRRCSSVVETTLLH